MSHRRHLADDLWLPDPETTKTVQAGCSPLPFEENCNVHVLSQRAIETMMVRKRIPVEVAPTVLIEAVQESEAETADLQPTPAPRKTSTLPFALILIAISLVSVLMGVLIAPLIVG